MISRRAADVASLPLEQLRELVAANVERLAALGSWPEWIAPESILERIPAEGEEASGFDAGVACTLDLIPRDKQRLSAILHAAYTPQAVAQARAEIEAGLDPDTETCWWLTACSVCIEGRVDPDTFRAQLEQFSRLAADPQARSEAAAACYAEMTSTFTDTTPGLNGVPFGDVDGCMQGAYLGGHELAAMRADLPGEEPLFFLGTFHPSLGLEDFPWSDELDGKGRPRSGGVHGSRQYVKATDWDELVRAAAVARAHLGC